MFEIPTLSDVYLKNFQSRVERHGDVPVIAVDLSCSFKTHSSVLDLINAKYRAMYYCNLTDEEKKRREEEVGQTGMDLPVSDLPNLRVTDIEYPVKHSKEYSGHTCRIPHGIDDSTAVVLRVCKVTKLRFTPIEGGSVEIEFNVSSSADITEHTLAVMPHKQQTSFPMQLTAPVMAEGDLIDASKDAPDLPPNGTTQPKPGKGKGKGKASATDAFVDAHAPTNEEGAPTH